MTTRRDYTDDRVEWYTSNSYRRLGLADEYHELMWGVVAPDGVPDIRFSNPEVARRIVACWNACRGIPTTVLEGGIRISVTS